MDTTIRNIDEKAFRSLKAKAALEGKNIGDLLSDAIRLYLSSKGIIEKTGSLKNIKPIRFPEGNEHLSEEIDSIVYGK